jgi:hypothetical protein
MGKEVKRKLLQNKESGSVTSSYSVTSSVKRKLLQNKESGSVTSS